MIGCTICGKVIMVGEELADEEMEYYVCPNCREEYNIEDDAAHKHNQWKMTTEDKV